MKNPYKFRYWHKKNYYFLCFTQTSKTEILTNVKVMLYVSTKHHCKASGFNTNIN